MTPMRRRRTLAWGLAVLLLSCALAAASSAAQDQGRVLGGEDAEAARVTPAQVARLTRRIRRHPKRAELYVERALLHSQRGHLKRAREDLARARRLDPDLAAVDLALAQVFLHSRRLPQAREAIDRYLARAPSAPEGHRVRAEVLYQQGEYPEAAAEYTRFLQKTDQPRPKHYLRRAQAIASIGETELQRAVASLDEGLRKLGPTRKLKVYAIELAAQAGDYDDALRRLDAILAGAKYKERWLSRKGDVLLQAGRLAEARAAYEQSLQAVTRRRAARRNSELRQLREHVEQRLAELDVK